MQRFQTLANEALFGAMLDLPYPSGEISLLAFQSRRRVIPIPKGIDRPLECRLLGDDRQRSRPVSTGRLDCVLSLRHQRYGTRLLPIEWRLPSARRLELKET